MDLLEALGLPPRPDWMRDGLCREYELSWFDGPQDEQRAICRRCLVVDECLAYAIENREQGTWGGTDEAERRDLRKAA